MRLHTTSRSAPSPQEAPATGRVLPPAGATAKAPQAAELPGLDPVLVERVLGALKGARQAKLRDSLAVITQSLEQGSWIPRGSIKANSGFYQGCGSRYPSMFSNTSDSPLFQLHMSMAYGHAVAPKDVEPALKRFAAIESLPPEKVAFLRDWVHLCNKAYATRKALNEARPRPVVTRIGLSPKVTATLKEMNLDLDLPSITPARIAFREVQDWDKAGNLRWNKDGSPLMKTVPYVDWSKGIRHNQSRFTGGGCCQACGKPIPSGLFAPVEAKDLKSGDLVSLWLGLDCARNIFGVKDVGIERNPVPE